jgi:hypothetical protein
MQALASRAVESQDPEVWSDYLNDLPEGALVFPDGDDLLFGDNPEWSLAIPKTLIGQLWPFVNGGARMLPGRGLEVGGLLVGPKVEGGGIVVDGFIPLPIEYRYGPSYHMSPADMARIAPVIESIQLDPSKAIVGFYRSRTRGDEALRASDYDILDAIERVHPSFEADFRCYFILAPVSESDALAHIALRDGGPWYQMVPFRLRSDPPTVILPPAVEINRLTWRARIFLYLYALTAIAGLASGYHWSIIRQPRPPSTAPVEAAAVQAHLQFSARPDGPAWKLTWDPASISALRPVGAILSIEDGGYQQQVPLAPVDLAGGNLIYRPESNDLTFRLRVDRGGSHVEEHVRVLAAAKMAPKSVLNKTRAQAKGKPRRTKAPHKWHPPGPPKPQLENVKSIP